MKTVSEARSISQNNKFGQHDHTIELIVLMHFNRTSVLSHYIATYNIHSILLPYLNHGFFVYSYIAHSIIEMNLKHEKIFCRMALHKIP